MLYLLLIVIYFKFLLALSSNFIIKRALYIGMSAIYSNKTVIKTYLLRKF